MPFIEIFSVLNIMLSILSALTDLLFTKVYKIEVIWRNSEVKWPSLKVSTYPNWNLTMITDFKPRCSQSAFWIVSHKMCILWWWSRETYCRTQAKITSHNRLNAKTGKQIQLSSIKLDTNNASEKMVNNVILLTQFTFMSKTIFSLRQNSLFFHYLY